MSVSRGACQRYIRVNARVLTAVGDVATLRLCIDSSCFATYARGFAAGDAGRRTHRRSRHTVRARSRNADAARRGDWDGLTAGLDAGQLGYPLIDALARAWAQVGRGDMDRALAAFDTVIATRGMVSFGLYHKALALAFVGDFEAADAILSLPPVPLASRDRSIVLVFARELARCSSGRRLPNIECSA